MYSTLCFIKLLLPISQNFPENAAGHRHAKEFLASTQEEPLKQGSVRHWSAAKITKDRHKLVNHGNMSDRCSQNIQYLLYIITFHLCFLDSNFDGKLFRNHEHPFYTCIFG